MVEDNAGTIMNMQQGNSQKNESTNIFIEKHDLKITCKMKLLLSIMKNIEKPFLSIKCIFIQLK